MKTAAAAAAAAATTTTTTTTRVVHARGMRDSRDDESSSSFRCRNSCRRHYYAGPSPYRSDRRLRRRCLPHPSSCALHSPVSSSPRRTRDGPMANAIFLFISLPLPPKRFFLSRRNRIYLVSHPRRPSLLDNGPSVRSPADPPKLSLRAHARTFHSVYTHTK